jgi:hypothetical protein
MTLDDPVAFAHALYGHLAADADPRVCDPASADGDIYKSAFEVLRARYPQEAAFGGGLTALDEAAMTWTGASHAAGIAFGIAAERLRRALTAGR